MLQFVVWFESIWIVHVHFAGWKFGQFSVIILSTVILLVSFGFISQEVPDVLPVMPGEAWDCLIWERGCHPIFWSFPEPFLMSLHLDRCTRINMQTNIDTSRYCIDIHLTCHWWFKRIWSLSWCILQINFNVVILSNSVISSLFANEDGRTQMWTWMLSGVFVRSCQIKRGFTATSRLPSPGLLHFLRVSQKSGP